MTKRRNKDPGGQRQVHPTRSFEQLVADATLSKLGGYIDDEIHELGQSLLIRQQQAMSNLLTRLVAVEEILTEKLGMTKDDLSNRVAAVQDRFEGFNEVTDRAVETGDRVRLEIATRTADQSEYQGSSRLQIENAGSGQTLGSEIEGAVVGMKTGETKEITFGKDASLAAKITVNRISAKPKAAAAKTEATDEGVEEATAGLEAVDESQAQVEAVSQEAPNAGAAAG